MSARKLPEGVLGGEAAHLVAFLGFHRDTVIEKCRSLPPVDLTRSRVPSGWTPIALLQHLVSLERRWVQWAFLGEPIADPWDDSAGRPDAPWVAPDGVGVDDLVDRLRDQAARTDALLAVTPLDTPCRPGGRFTTGGPAPPDLRWIGFHLLQEYARHAGHLDVAVELAGGRVGE